MEREFNIEGSCNPTYHYMVDISKKLDLIEKFVEKNKYFTINRARQFGKTTTLKALTEKLKDKYIVLSISFESIAEKYYESEETFSDIFIRKIVESLKLQKMDSILLEFWKNTDEIDSFYSLALKISDFCSVCKKEVILLVDEVDKSSDNKMFLSFLGMLRERYLKRDEGIITFKSVILAGVYDVKNLKLKLRPDEEGKYNSPWNIAAKFNVDMSFSVYEIETMLIAYEKDKHVGFDTHKIAQKIFDYTNGYPFLVSSICKCIDEELCEEYGFDSLVNAWTFEGISRAVKIMILESNLLFDDIDKKIEDNDKLRKLLKNMLIKGVKKSFVAGSKEQRLGVMFGLFLQKNGNLVISNRIFETYLYNKFMEEDEVSSEFSEAIEVEGKEKFIKNGALDMELILKVFQKHYMQYYKDEQDDKNKKFIEDNGRFLFLTFIRPIINGEGNFYVEARTRNARRTDVVIDYHAKQYIIELKIWNGDEYNKRGEAQTFDYLSYYGVDKGYMVSFNFNKNKKISYEKIEYNGKTIVEVVL